MKWDILYCRKSGIAIWNESIHAMNWRWMYLSFSRCVAVCVFVCPHKHVCSISFSTGVRGSWTDKMIWCENLSYTRDAWAKWQFPLWNFITWNITQIVAIPNSLPLSFWLAFVLRYTFIFSSSYLSLVWLCSFCFWSWFSLFLSLFL